ncbi:hypothetical protein [Flavobacterium sp.]|jgi:hypothetical protein|uniref:hypothetical protein n=1 Tax=Flavobacterium sp. TaxID=239 RepID=UPI0037BFB58A
MKIITDKINTLPNHSISRKEVQIILDNVTHEKFGIAKVFKISAQLFENSNWERPVIMNGSTYNILSRGLEKDFVIRELLIEIYVNATNIHYSMKSHKLNADQRKKLEEIISPIYQKVIGEIKSLKTN